jgi:hypothetical protein
MTKRWLALIHVVLVLAFFALGMIAAAQASEIRDIELTDGSVITGEIVSLSNGIYTVRSGSLGTVKIKESAIRAIRAKGQAVGPAPTDQGNSIKEKMVSDPEIMSIIETLRNDPDFQEVMRDPEIVNAVRAGDFSALMANPKFMKLLDNKAIKQIQNKLSK